MSDDLTMNGAIPSIRYQAIVQWVCGRLYRLIGLLLLSAALLKSHELSRGELRLTARTADAILPIALIYAESIVGERRRCKRRQNSMCIGSCQIG